MTQFKFFWICSSIIIFSGCSGFQTKPYSFSNPSNDFVAEYCQSGKQKKAYKITVLYFTPPVEKGLSLDKAIQKNKNLSERKNALLKDFFYLIGDQNSQGQSTSGLKFNQLDGNNPNWYSLVSKNESDVLNNIKNEDSDTKYLLLTFIVKVEGQNKFVVYQTNQESRRMNYDKGYSTDLNNLMSEYTLLAPKEAIEQITESEFDGNSTYAAIILNENGEVDLSKAIDNRDRLWKAYIKKFTSVKESSEDNSQKAIIELSLDLNTFCKYGRRISDIQSQ